MKYLSTILALLFFSSLHAQSSLSGRVTDLATGEELIAANVKIYQGELFVYGVTTDFEGNYRVNLDPGVYDVLVEYVGYLKSKTNGVIVKAGQNTRFDIPLSTGISLDEVVIIESDKATERSKVTRKEAKKLASKDISPPPPPPPVEKISEIEEEIFVSGSRTKATESYAEGVKVTAIDAVEDDVIELSAVESTKATTESGGPSPSTPTESAGQLTAGEWKDLDNWTFWENLMKNEQFAQYQEHWGYHPQQRFSVKLSDEQGRALANVSIQLLNQSDEVVWESKSDNKGGAELWGNFFGAKDSDFKLRVQQDQYQETFAAMNYTAGINSLSLPLNCSANKDVDVVFVVDVTGSMGDELEYLKAEASDVIQRSEEELSIKLRTGAVCYTDRSEANTLRTVSFSEDEKETIDFLQKQNLGSGGDYPEAVDLGLGHAINEMDWNENAIARIVFLMLDAPPHHVEEEMKSLEKSIQLAAAKGIKVIPIASSGVNKETEFLLKFFTMATNGTYTFLTDHSGIGNSHIKPEAGDYNIETLNDMMVRLIGESSDFHDCAPVEDFVEKGAKQKKLTWKERRNKELKKFTKQIKCFPNPATDYVFVDMEEDIDLLLVTDSKGKTIQQLPKLRAGQVKLNTSNWAGAVYFFHFYQGGKHVVEKVMVTGADGVVRS